MTTINPIVGVFAIAGATVVLTACSDAERKTVAFALKGVGIEDTITVQELEDVPEPETPPEPCVLVGMEWRLYTCENGVKTLIP